MGKILQPMMGQNVQAYADDMVVTFERSKSYCSSLEEFFKTIGMHHLKLNLEKCVFGFD